MWDIVVFIKVLCFCPNKSMDSLALKSHNSSQIIIIIIIIIIIK